MCAQGIPKRCLHPTSIPIDSTMTKYRFRTKSPFRTSSANRTKETKSERRRLVVESLEARLPLASDVYLWGASSELLSGASTPGIPAGVASGQETASHAGRGSSDLFTNNAPPTVFAPPIHYATAGSLYGLASGDFNSDGIVDLAASNYDMGRLDVLLGRGDGSFQSPVGYPVGGSPLEVTVADIDLDGHLDLATGNYSGRQIAILYGNGDGTFADRIVWNNSLFPKEIAVADMNGDGIQDLVSANYDYSAGTISVLLGTGNRSFGPMTDFVSGNGSSGVAIADFNGDASLDVVTTDYHGGTISILFNNGSGALGGRVAYASGSVPAWLLSADFDSDGATDVAVGNHESHELVVFHGNGDGTLQTPIKIAAGGNITFVRRGEFNGDSNFDFAASIPNLNSIAIFAGQADGSWSNPTYLATGSNPVGLVATDLDGNGTTDLASANRLGQSVSVLRNLAPAANPHLSLSAPTATTLGTPVTVTVSALDANGLVATNFTGTVQFKSSDRFAQLPVDYTFTAADQGVKTFDIAFQSLGEHTVSARLALQPSIVDGSGVRVLSPFTAQAGGPYRVAENSSLIVRGSVVGRVPSSVTFQWDLDGDGIFGETGGAATQGDEVGASPEMITPSVNSDSNSFIRLRIIDGSGLVAESSAAVNLFNRNPLDTPIPDETGEILVTNNLFNNARYGWENTWIAANDDGRKVVTWDPYLNGAHTSWMGIAGKVYNANNEPIAGEFAVQQLNGGDNTTVPHVDIAEDGSIVFVWQTWGGDGQGWGIRARSMAPNFSWRTGDFQVNHSIQADSQVEAKVAILNDGNFVVTWQDHSPWGDGSGYSVWAKVLSPTGAWISNDFRVNDQTYSDQHIAIPVATPDGGFAVAYTSYNETSGASDMVLRRFNASGSPLGASFKPTSNIQANRYRPMVAFAPDGRYLVAWQINYSGSRAADIFAQLMSADDQPIGGEFKVNTHTLGDQATPEIAVDVSGDFVVSWNSNEQDGSLSGLYAQRIHADGYAIGSEFRVNSYTNDAQWGSSVDFGAPGELVFSWKSEGQFSGYSGAVMRTFELGNRNLPPEAVAGGPYAVTEGNALSLSASLSSDPNGDALTYSWDINGDGVYGDATGVAPSLNWPQLRALGIDGTATVPVRVQVSDGVNPPVNSSLVNLVVTNLPPTIALSGAASVDEGSNYSLTLGPVSDPGLDTVSQATVRWGDSTSTTVSSLGVVSHVYADGRIGASSTNSVTFTEIVVADTMVNDASGFGGPNVPHGSNSVLWATNWFNPGAGGSLASYPLFKFDLSEIGLTEIQGDATFRAYLLGPTTSSHHFGDPRRVDLYQITSPWNEATTTYNTRPSASYLNSQNVVYYGNNRWVEWTVPQSILQGWLDHPETNHGLMLVNELPDSFFYDLVFAAREFGQGLEPQLVFQAAGPIRIQVDLTDEDGLHRSAGTHLLAVNNVAPVGSANGPTQVVPFQPFDLQLIANDPSPIDQAAGFQFELDWDNDGSFDQSLTQAASGTTVPSTFSTLGSRVVRIRVTDKDGGSSEFQHTIEVRPFYLDGDLFIGGSDADDTFIVRQGNTSNTVSATRNGASIGTFSTQTVRLFAGPGTDTITVEGNGLANVMAIDPNRITSDSMTALGIDAELWIANGQAGSDTLISRSLGDTLWDVTGINAGQLITSSGSTAFLAMENLQGHTGNDTFAFRDGQRVTGRVMGGAGSNTLDFSAYTTPINVNLQSSTVPPTGGFENIQSFRGGSAADTLIGANTGNTWSIQSNSLVSLNSTTTIQEIQDFETLSGGSLNDEFVVGPGVSQGPRVLGGNGIDHLSYLQRTDDIVIDRQSRTATSIVGFDTIENFTGGSGRDTWIGLNTPTTWTLSATEVASIPGTNLLRFERLVGGSLADTFQVTASGVQTEIDAGNGNDLVIAPNVPNVWTIDGLASGRLVNGVVFSQVENLRGGTSTDRWSIGSSGGGLISIDGNTGSDTLDYSSWNTPLTFQLGSRTANGVQQYNAIESILGGTGIDSVLGPNTAATYSINGPDSVLAAGVQFESIEQWTSGAGNDVFTIATSNAAISGFIDAGVGTDTLNGFNAPTDWRLTGPQSGTLNSNTAFLRFENLNGSGAADQFFLLPAAGGFGTINGGPGTASDTIDYSSYGSAVSVGIFPAVAPGMTSFAAIESFVGSGLSDSIQGPTNTNTTWTLSGANMGRVGTTNFSSFENLQGGPANDTFQWNSATVSLSGLATGGSGMDQVTGFGMDNTWSLQSPNAGNLNNRFAFAGIENLSGGALADTFQMNPTAGNFGTVNGGSGTDTIDYSAYGSAVSVALATTSSTGFGLVQGIEAWVGSSVDDRFTGPNTPLSWTISGDQAVRMGSVAINAFEEIVGGSSNDTFSFTSASGRVPTLRGGVGIDTLIGFLQSNAWSVTGVGSGTVNADTQFSEFENLTGGGLEDWFSIGSSGSVPGTLSGGAGANTLSYEAWALPVQVNQIVGKATNINNLSSNFQTILGGTGNDLLTAFASLASVLVGNAGDDTLTGSSNRDILIGGSGADILRGQAADDVLLGGWSGFDTHPFALQRLLAEWNSPRSVANRINNLRGNIITGTPLNQGYFLTQAPGGRTVFDDGAIDTLFGSTGSDWFIAAADDVLSDRLLTESWDELNNT